MADPIAITDLTGGRNGIDSPLELPQNQCAEALNVDWTAPLGEKRRGAVVVDTSGGSSFSNAIRSMFRHVPEGVDEDAELWAVDGAGLVKRLVAGAWSNVILTDPIVGNYGDVHFATLDGKLFMAYNSGLDRLHVWDPTLGRVRRVGLSIPGAPSISDNGVGVYAATNRYYRVRVIQWDGTTVTRRSEPSTSVFFTPSGLAADARVTRGTVPGENETHWEIEVSLDNDTWFVLAGVDGADLPIVLATTTYEDARSESDYLDLESAEGVGEFTLPKSAKYLSTDQNRLLMAGSWMDSALSSHIYFTPVLGASDHGDSERVIITDDVAGFVALNVRDGGEIKGLSYPIQGTIYAFKYRQTWKLVPTGNADAPYLTRKIHESIGCIHAKSIVMAEDAVGNPVVGFLSTVGPYHFGLQGIAHIGRDVEDIWYGTNGRESEGDVNLDASVVGHGVYHSDMHQIWWFLTLDTDDTPSIRIVLDVRRNVKGDAFGMRGGWALHEGKGCKAVCSVMFAETIGATMSKRLKPYMGYLAP